MTMDKKSPQRDLTQGNILKTLGLFSLPILLSNVLQTIHGSINAVWVGHYLGENALAATSIANTLIFYCCLWCSA